MLRFKREDLDPELIGGVLRNKLAEGFDENRTQI